MWEEEENLDKTSVNKISLKQLNISYFYTTKWHSFIPFK